MSGYDCVHKTGEERERLCDLCGDRSKVTTVYGCDIHGECTTNKVIRRVRSCATCEDFRERER